MQERITTRRTLAVTLALAALCCSAQATPTSAEIEQLGKSLTPLGAEMAGNKEGTIPAWDGGVCTPPAGYKPANGKSGTPYVDPFAADKPLYTINAKNADQYADKLAVGAKVLLKRYPDSFRIDVYPTRRSACFPSWVYDNTIKRAAKPKLEADGLGVSGAQAQFPFPIPKNGYEVMWNALLNFYTTNEQQEYGAYYYDQSGNRVLGYQSITDHTRPYWDNTRTDPLPDDVPYWSLVSRQHMPASNVGNATLRINFARADRKDPMAWSYVPGQRRVRMAPEFKYDSVSTATGGILLYDEINGFDGKMDKYQFKLIGKREMIVPYNSYGHQQPIEKTSMPRHISPDYWRWELHRVWVVEADLKPGERHVQKKKIFYVDEDSWIIVQYDGIDQMGVPHHMSSFSLVQEYEKPMMRGGFFATWDFNKGTWFWNKSPGKFGTGTYTVGPYSANFFTPGTLQAAGVR
jgi:hypothetical protein